MLLDSSFIKMNITFTLKSDTNHLSATAFPKIFGDFLGEDSYAYSNPKSYLLKILTYSCQMTRWSYQSLKAFHVQQW